MKFYEKTWFMWVMLIFLTPVGVFLMWKYNRYNKVVRITMSIVFVVIWISAISGDKQASNNTNTQQVSTSSQPTPTISEEDKAKQQADAEAKKKAEEQAIAEQKAKEEAEAKAKAEFAAKEWADFVAKNTKKLSAGQYTIGTHIDKGVYDVTFNGSGNFFVYDNNDSPITNEIGGSKYGISKYRALFPEGGRIELSSMGINVKPAQRSLVPYSTFNLCSGYWYVGIDVTKGRYKVTPVKGSGNFFVYDKNGYPKANEILGGQYGIGEYVLEIEDGDLINIAGIESVKFEPSN